MYKFEYFIMLYMFSLLLYNLLSNHQWLIFSIDINSFSMIIFLQLYKDEVFMTMFYYLLLLWNCCLINYTTLMVNNVNTISGDENLIKGSRRAYTRSLVVFDSMWMTLYTILDPEESCMTNLVPQGKRSYGWNQMCLFSD